MRDVTLPRAVRSAGFSPFERHVALTGVLLVLMATVAAVASADPGGRAREAGLAGLGALVLCGAARGARAYCAGVAASVPTSVGRTPLVRPARAFALTAAVVSLALPVAAVAALLALVPWAWLVVAVVAVLGAAGALVGRLRAIDAELTDGATNARAADLLARLCLRLDLPVPGLVVEPSAVATAWTSGGRIHVTAAALKLLDDGELEAVLAHELAHLARRDAAIMDLCSAPSRILLTYSAGVGRRLWPWTRELVATGVPVGVAIAMWLVAALSVPPAFVVGWLSRLSTLGLSRAREFAADAAAAALTGRPSALASALLKLDGERGATPRLDLRRAEPLAVLSIVGASCAGLGGLLRTHPPTAARVARLTAMERRLQTPT